MGLAGQAQECAVCKRAQSKRDSLALKVEPPVSISGWVGSQRGPATRRARQDGLCPARRGWTSRTLGS